MYFMSTDPSLALMEIPSEIHAKVKTLSLHTGIKMKHLSGQLVKAGLKSKYIAEQVECGILKNDEGDAPDE